MTTKKEQIRDLYEKIIKETDDLTRCSISVRVWVDRIKFSNLSQEDIAFVLRSITRTLTTLDTTLEDVFNAAKESGWKHEEV